MLRKNKAAKAEPEVPASLSLEERINQIRAEAEEFIEAKVQELKASPEGQSLPIDWLRQNLYARTRSAGCYCRCALAVIEENK